MTQPAANTPGMSGPLAVVIDPRFEHGPLLAQARTVAGDNPVLGFVADPAGTESPVSVDLDRVVALGGDGMPGADAETLTVALEEVCQQEQPAVVAIPSAVDWREVAAPLAVRLGGSVTSEVTELRRGADGTLLADRLLYSGLVVATVAMLASPAVITVALLEAPRAPPREAMGHQNAPVDRGGRVLISRGRRQDGADGAGAASAGLSGAERIVAVGRGLRRREDLSLVEELCRALDAELGASRPLIEDSRWLPAERQVGLSGHTVKPELYLAVGISGQIQHLVGMRESHVVVAINSDPKAPIFEAADVGIVADLYEVLPRLITTLTGRAGGD